MFEITIPVLNEEKTLKENVLVIYHYLKTELPEFADWNIVIADNGSTDQTPQIGKLLAQDHIGIKMITLREKGVGLALQTSWRQSTADIVGYMDLDLATDLRHFKEALYALTSGYDFVYGSRLHKDAIVLQRSITREVSSRCFNFIVRHYLGVHSTDGMCGFKFMKRVVFQHLFSSGAQSKGWFFSTELVVWAEWLGYTLYELPVHWTDSKESHVKIIPLTVQYLKAMQVLKRLKPKQSNV